MINASPHVINASQAISKIFKLLDVNKDGDIEKKELRGSMAKVPDRYQTDRQTEKRAA